MASIDSIAAQLRSQGLSGTRRVGPNGETAAELAAQVSGEAHRAGILPSILHNTAGVLTRTFDVLSRPLYGVAEGTRQAVQEVTGNETDSQNILGGIIRGLEGKEKTTFSRVLKEAGVRNNLIRGIAGFGLDIAADPLTYVGGGIVKRIAEEKLAKIGGEAANEAFKTAGKSSVGAMAAAYDARLSAKALAREAGQDVTSKAVRTAVHEAASKAQEDFAYEAGLAASDVARKAAREAAPGAVELRFLGRPVAESQALYDVGKKVSGRVAQTTVGNALNKAFRPVATFKAGTNEMLRRVKGQGLMQYENAAREVSRKFVGVSPESKRLITHAIENGTELPADLEPLRQFAKDVLDSTFDVEAAMDLRSEADRAANYVHDVFPSLENDSDLVKEFVAARKREIKVARDANLKRIGKGQAIQPVVIKNTLDVAKEMGLRPVEEIDSILRNKLAKSFHTQGRVRFAHAVSSEFGLTINKDLAKKLGLVRSTAKYVPQGTYLPREIESTLHTFDRVLDNEAAGSALRDLYDKALGALKFGQTAINPGHHIRNAISDIFNNFKDGVINPQHYADSAHILRRINQVDGPVEAALLNPIQIKVGNQVLDDEDIWKWFVHAGGKSGFFDTEAFEFAKNPSGLVQMIRRGSEVREDWGRLAHFIDAMQKEGAKAKTVTELRYAAERAGARVRKFNIDYGDLTPFERKVMKRIVPFYTWMRRNTPLQIENLFLRPGRQMVGPKLIHGLQDVLGAEDDPTLSDIHVLPDWMKSAMSVALIGEGQGRNGIYWTPGGLDPLMDIGNILGGEHAANQLGLSPGDIIRNFLSQTSPLIRSPFELSTGQNLFTGHDLNQSNLQYASGQIPLGRLGWDILSGNFQPARAANWMTGLGFRELTEAQQKGEIRRQEDIIQRILRAKREQENAQRQEYLNSL